MVSHQGGLSSGWSLIAMVFHQVGLKSGWSPIRVSLIKVVSRHGRLIRAIFGQGGILSRGL